jgi:hypothetical protein
MEWSRCDYQILTIKTVKKRNDSSYDFLVDN